MSPFIDSANEFVYGSSRGLRSPPNSRTLLSPAVSILLCMVSMSRLPLLVNCDARNNLIGITPRCFTSLHDRYLRQSNPRFPQSSFISSSHNTSVLLTDVRALQSRTWSGKRASVSRTSARLGTHPEHFSTGYRIQMMMKRMMMRRSELKTSRSECLEIGHVGRLASCRYPRCRLYVKGAWDLCQDNCYTSSRSTRRSKSRADSQQ